MTNPPRRAARKKAAAPTPAVTQAQLVEFMAGGLVSAVAIVEANPHMYRVEVVMTWRQGRSVLTALRGNVRHFKNLDRLIRFLRDEIGLVLPSDVRLELKPT